MNLFDRSDLGDSGIPIRLAQPVLFNTGEPVAAATVRPSIASPSLAEALSDLVGADAEGFRLATRIFALDLRSGDEVVVRASENGLPLIVRRDGAVIVNFDVGATQAFDFPDSKRPLYTYVPGFNIQKVPESIRRPVSNVVKSFGGPRRVDVAAQYRQLPLTGFEFTLLMLNAVLTDGPPARQPVFQWPFGKRAVFVALHDVDTDGFLRRGERDVLFRVEAKHDIRSTWFVPTAILTRQKENIAFLLESGNEIGWHGHRHDHRDHIKPFADRAVQALSKSGLTESADYPTGMRAPRLLKTKYLFELLERSCPALCYDTSFLQGIAPYNLWLNGRQSNLLEIPTTVPTDIRVHNELSGLPRAEKAEAILRAQIARTDKLIEAGGLISIVTHPEKSLSERPDLLDVYDQYLSYIRSRTDVWFATAGELFRHWTRDLHNGARKPSVAKLPMLCLLYLSLLFQPIRTPLSPGRIMPRAQKAPVAASRTITTNMTAYGAGGRSN